MPQDTTLYDWLHVKPDADADTIKGAYRKLVKQYHPDLLGREPTEEEGLRWTQIQQAWQILSSEELRQEYDATGVYEGVDKRKVSPEELLRMKAIGIIAEIVNGLFVPISEQWVDNFIDKDLIEGLNRILDTNLGVMAEKIDEGTKKAQGLRKAAARVTIKDGQAEDGGANVIASVMLARAGKIEATVAAFEEAQEEYEAAKKIVASHDFEADKVLQYRGVGAPFTSSSSTASIMQGIYKMDPKFFRP